MLAGHTHAMQLKFGNHSPSSYIYPEWSGMYLEGTRGLYVNEGIGYVGLPFRFGAWPGNNSAYPTTVSTLFPLIFLCTCT